VFSTCDLTAIQAFAAEFNTSSTATENPGNRWDIAVSALWKVMEEA
jgi:hypothetical protein